MEFVRGDVAIVSAGRFAGHPVIITAIDPQRRDGANAPIPYTVARFDGRMFELGRARMDRLAMYADGLRRPGMADRDALVGALSS